jgi:hypothetical protein
MQSTQDSKYCIICHSPITHEPVHARLGVKLVHCRACGDYEADDLELFAIGDKRPKGFHIVAARLRHRFELTGLPLSYPDRAIRTLPTDELGPTVTERLLKVLLAIADRSPRFGHPVPIANDVDWPLLTAVGPDEVAFLLAQQASQKFIVESGGWVLTATGWALVDEMRRTRINTKQAFVAMWFDSSLEPAWREGFEVGLRECGYTPVRIDQVEHTGQITDRILAEIRGSGIVVADFTGNRHGVYFEAGFAMGLETPVIWTCREDALKDLHFDTKQYNHIVWKEPADLREKLRDRVRALFPFRP